MNDSIASAPVLVVGGGCSGLATALELVRQGQPVRVLDKAEAPNTESRGTGLQARTLELLNLYGIGDDIAVLGNRNEALAFFENGKRIGAIDFTAGSSRFNYSPSLPQAVTEGVLRKRLAAAGVNVEWGTELVALQQVADHVVVRLRSNGTDGETRICTPWLVACDGARSPIRAMLDVPFAGLSYPEGWALMDATLEWELPPTEVRIFQGDEPGQFVVVPLGGTLYRLQTDSRAAGMDGLPPTVAEMQTALEKYARRDGTISAPRWASAFRIHRRQVVEYRHQRVLLAGDAAHIHTPAGAQGLNTGIQDGINLGWKLAMVVRGVADVRLLDTYQAERQPIAAGVLELAETLARSPFEMLKKDRRPPAVRADTVQQLLVNYRNGPLGQPVSSKQMLVAGDRVPDLVLGNRRLYDLLSRQGLVVIAASNANDSLEAMAKAWKARWGSTLATWTGAGAGSVGADRSPSAPSKAEVASILAALGIEEGFAIVRPDAYLGLTGSAPPERAVEEVNAYLADRLHLLTCAEAA